MKIKIILLALFLQFAAGLSFAQDSVSYSIRRSYISPRAMGMGDAFVAVANDYSALFYNPAGLAFRESGEMNFSIDFAASSAFGSFVKDISTASSTQGTESQKQTAMANAITAQYGKTFSTRITPAAGVWVRPGWGIGIIPADVSIELQPNNPLIINTTAYVDTTVAVGYADSIKSFENAKAAWGITGKFVNRGFYSKSISGFELLADSSFLKSSDLKEGYFLDADVGFLLKPHIPDDGFISVLRLARPTFGLVVRNIVGGNALGTFKLFNKTDVTKPIRNYRVIDIGSRWEYPELWLFGGRGVLDIKDIMHPSFSLKRGLHLGLEFDWTVASWWKGQYRVGYSQGYVSAGLSALFTVFNLDLVTYGEEVGTMNTAAENRVYMAKANINF
jgi:hypothetical protein